MIKCAGIVWLVVAVNVCLEMRARDFCLTEFLDRLKHNTARRYF